jgi:hypothetical protein
MDTGSREENAGKQKLEFGSDSIRTEKAPVRTFVANVQVQLFATANDRACSRST